EPFSAVPSKLGVESLVMLSLLEEPESLKAFRSGVEGAAGAAVSIVTVSEPEAEPVLPAVSVALALIAWSPSASALESIDQLPPPSAAALPTCVAPAKSLTVELASAVPVKVGVESLGML